MTKEFAKLFWVEGIGQILVKRDTDDDDGNPEVRFYVKPEGLGVCALASGFRDDEEGQQKADDLFARVDADLAAKVVRQYILGLTGGDE